MYGKIKAPKKIQSFSSRSSNRKMDYFSWEWDAPLPEELENNQDLSLSVLHDHCLTEVMQWLPFKDRLKLAAVNSQWKRCAFYFFDQINIQICCYSNLAFQGFEDDLDEGLVAVVLDDKDLEIAISFSRCDTIFSLNLEKLQEISRKFSESCFTNFVIEIDSGFGFLPKEAKQHKALEKVLDVIEPLLRKSKRVVLNVPDLKVFNRISIKIGSLITDCDFQSSDADIYGIFAKNYDNNDLFSFNLPNSPAFIYFNPMKRLRSIKGFIEERVAVELNNLTIFGSLQEIQLCFDESSDSQISAKEFIAFTEKYKYQIKKLAICCKTFNAKDKTVLATKLEAIANFTQLKSISLDVLLIRDRKGPKSVSKVISVLSEAISTISSTNETLTHFSLAIFKIKARVVVTEDGIQKLYKSIAKLRNLQKLKLCFDMEMQHIRGLHIFLPNLAGLVNLKELSVVPNLWIGTSNNGQIAERVSWSTLNFIFPRIEFLSVICNNDSLKYFCGLRQLRQLKLLRRSDNNEKFSDFQILNILQRNPKLTMVFIDGLSCLCDGFFLNLVEIAKQRYPFDIRLIAKNVDPRFEIVEQRNRNLPANLKVDISYQF